jgi:hypothetical protein
VWPSQTLPLPRLERPLAPARQVDPTPKSRERLADHYLRTARIAAICIHAYGAFMAYRTIGLELPAGLVCFGCMRRDAKRLAAHARRCRGDQAGRPDRTARRGSLQGLSVTRTSLRGRCTRSQRSMTGSAKCRPLVAWLRSTAPRPRAPQCRRSATHLDAFKLKMIEKVAALRTGHEFRI